MKVKDLIARLQSRCDPEDEVVLLSQVDGYDPTFSLTKVELVFRREPYRQGYGTFVSTETRPGTRAKRTKAVVLT